MTVLLPLPQRAQSFKLACDAGFLDHCSTDPLAPVFETIEANGLRHGEVLGLR